MGGRAFAQKIPRAVFPRLNSAAYDAQKRAILPRIQALYRLATVPAEAPGKCDHGDLDILVAHPIHGDETLGMVGAAIGAKDCILQPGNRTSNFAVPLQLAASPLAADDSLPHFQVDVHVCDNEGEYERILFHHSYGDVGLIVGVIASGVGLHFGTKGLRTGMITLNECSPFSLELSQSSDDILRFFGLSMKDWKQGFQNQDEIFDWIRTSRFFDPRDVVADPKNNSSGRRDRVMYQEFVRQAEAIALTGSEIALSSAPRPTRAAVLEEALDFFGCRQAFQQAIKRTREEHTRTSRLQTQRAILPSDKVRAWTGLDQARDWRTIKHLMDLVREELGGKASMEVLDEAAVKQTVLRLAPTAAELARTDFEAHLLKKDKASAVAPAPSN